jgi:hypothetical protein
MQNTILVAKMLSTALIMEKQHHLLKEPSLHIICLSIAHINLANQEPTFSEIVQLNNHYKFQTRTLNLDHPPVS